MSDPDAAREPSLRLSLRPGTLAECNAFVARHHRHHKPVVGHKFSIACEAGSALCGVVIVGHAIARHVDAPRTLELTRVCTDGTPHAASKLIAGATRAAFAMGCNLVISYILESEEGTSYKAAGWTRTEVDGVPVECGGGNWNSEKRGGQTAMPGVFDFAAKYPMGIKHRWEKRA